jgi:hypothetical protein
VFANRELMHTTLCASEGHSSTMSSDCILLYISCSKGAATTPSLYGLLASRHILYGKSECSHIFYAKPLATGTGKEVVFLGSLPFCFYFPLVALSSLVDVRRKCIRTNSGGLDMTGL